MVVLPSPEPEKCPHKVPGLPLLAKTTQTLVCYIIVIFYKNSNQYQYYYVSCSEYPTFPLFVNIKPIQFGMTEKELLAKIGQQVKAYRARKKLTQEQLGSLCNVEKAYISRFEAGQTNATVRTLITIAKALDVSVKDLMSIDN